MGRAYGRVEGREGKNLIRRAEILCGKGYERPGG